MGFNSEPSRIDLLTRYWQVSEGKLDIVAEGKTIEQAAAGPQPQAIFKTGQAAEQVTPDAQRNCCASYVLCMHGFDF